VNGRKLLSRPGGHEKKDSKDSIKPYREPGKVPLAEKAKTYRENLIKGIRQTSSVSLV
jgi:hypothetical protein